MAETLKHTASEAIVDYLLKNGIPSREVFVPMRGLVEEGDDQTFQVALKRFPGMYALENADGKTLRRQGFHTLAFAAYKRSLNWLLGGYSAEAAREILDANFHVDVKVSCFLSCLLSTSNYEGERTCIARFIYGLNKANEEYDKIQTAKASELAPYISSYLNCIAYIYHFAPYSTVYDGKADSLSDAAKTSRALRQLDGMLRRSLNSDDVNVIKQSAADLFDGKAIGKSFSQEGSSVLKMSFLILQVYRMLYPFKFLKYVKRFRDSTPFCDIVRHVLHLETVENKKIENAMQLIDDFRGYCHQRNPRNFSDVIAYSFSLKSKYNH